MALGGYKFKGYRYTVPSDFNSSDDSQVKAQCLQMFKCRLRAFMDSCSLSGAQWEFSYTDGDYSFGSYGNVIYDLDGNGYNHGAFLKYHGREQYMMLMNYQNGSHSRSSFFRIDVSSNYRCYDGCIAKSSTGLVPFTPDNWNSKLSKRLMLRGQFGPSSTSDVSPSVDNTRYGFATKGCDVIEIYNLTSNNNYMFKVMSPDGFSSLCSPDDITPVFDYAGYGKNYDYRSSDREVYHLNYHPIQSLKDDGSHFPYTSLYSEYVSNYGKYMSIFSQREAFYRSSINHVPYASPLITSHIYGDSTEGYCVNNDGIMSKGYVKPELMAINTIRPYSQMRNLNIYKPYANGNYILVEIFYTTNSDYEPTSAKSWYDGAIYVGWDPSNPDITQASSWEDYN